MLGAEPILLVWRRIEGPLLQDMYRNLFDERTRRRRLALYPRYLEMRGSHCKPDLFPSWKTFFSYPFVEALWNETVYPLPESVDLTGYTVFDTEKWSAALPSIEAAVLQYQEEVEALAIARLTAGYEALGLPVPPPTEILDDPRSIFRYKPEYRNGDILRSDDVLVLPFPAIHAKMRDRQDRLVSNLIFRHPCAAEFLLVPEVKVVGAYVGSLQVELKL